MLNYLENEINELPEAIQTLYTKREDGLYQLQIKGAIAEDEVTNLKTKIKEFRDSNIDLRKSNEALQSFEQVFGTNNIKPDAIQEKIQELAAVKASTLVTEMKTNYESKVKDLESNINLKQQKLSKLLLGDAVIKASNKHGVLNTAYDDVLRRAENDFEVTDDGLKFKHDKLNAEGQVYDLDSWLLEQAKHAPHLFSQSQGTGATKVGKSNKTLPLGTSRLAAGLQQRANPTGKRI